MQVLSGSCLGHNKTKHDKVYFEFTFVGPPNYSKTYFMNIFSENFLYYLFYV